MKNISKLIALLLTIIMTAGIVSACSAADGSGGYYDGGVKADGAAEAVSLPGDGSYSEEPEAGLLTAGAHSDNDYYAYYKSLFYKGQTENENGKFASYLAPDDWGLNALNRVKVTVQSGGAVVANADVTFSYDGGEYQAVTDSAGVAYVFGNTSGGTITAESAGNTASADVTEETEEVTLELSSAAEKSATIEIMFVIDVTGSMGDELDYINTELTDVIGSISSALDGVKINLAILCYRDDTDDSKFEYADFTDVTKDTNLAAMQSFLSKRDATGGGDYEEAVDEALQLAMEKQWSANSTKIIFHVLDAPPHSGTTYETRYKNAVMTAAEKGIRICPVLASGASELTEYLTRQAAILTGGTFVYLSDDSGIGNNHYDPDIPNVVIEKLNALIVRLVKGYYTGTFEAPVPYNGKIYTYYGTADIEDMSVPIYGLQTSYTEDETYTIYTGVFTSGKVVLLLDGEFMCYGEVVTESVDGGDPSEFLKFTFVAFENRGKITFMVITTVE